MAKTRYMMVGIGVALTACLYFYPALVVRFPNLAVLLVVGPPLALMAVLGYNAAQAETIALQSKQIASLVRQVSEGNAEIARLSEMMLIGSREVELLYKDLGERDELIRLLEGESSYGINGVGHG